MFLNSKYKLIYAIKVTSVFFMGYFTKCIVGKDVISTPVSILITVGALAFVLLMSFKVGKWIFESQSEAN